MTTIQKTNLDKFADFLQSGGQIPKLRDKYNHVITSNDHKKYCKRTFDIVNLINTSSSISKFDKLLLNYNQQMYTRYNEHYSQVFNEYSNAQENHKLARYVIMNPCKLAFNEEQNRLGIVVAFSTQPSGKKNPKLNLKLQIVAIDYETGEVVKTTWTVNRTKFLNYGATLKAYKSLGLTEMGVEVDDSNL